ncbi:hypothetical protein CSV69_15890 [Sporosarcina sp. P26b]|nr:hypothetical protein SporoP32a_11900 [Sporosarcina ureae]PIC94619.1 hypothetical protein CSV69_15890 [Sporosarcina sp. P26b]
MEIWNVEFKSLQCDVRCMCESDSNVSLRFRRTRSGGWAVNHTPSLRSQGVSPVPLILPESPPYTSLHWWLVLELESEVQDPVQVVNFSCM